MFAVEARVIGKILARMPVAEISPCLNVAGGTRDVREIWQPWMHEEIFLPLAERGVEVVHHDIQRGDGVDLVGDIHDPATQMRLRAVGANLVLCCNMLEHVVDRADVIVLLKALVPERGHLLITVPHSLQWHADPIDTMYRPSPEEIVRLFPEFDPMFSKSLVVGRLWIEFSDGGGVGTVAFRFMRFCWRMLVWLPQKRRWLSHAHSALWLVRRRRVSIVLLQKRARL
jgi:hypothetical protein